MPAANLPANEQDRIASLRMLQILDTLPEERFDRITRLAKTAFHVPVALISFVDTNRQWFKSCIGVDVSETDRDVAFCAHAILQHDTLVISDALNDPRFADNPLVTGAPFIRFYAGHPVRHPNGHALGTLCIIDQQPRTFSDDECRTLQDLAALVEQQLVSAELEQMVQEQQRAERALRESETRFRQMAENIREVFWMTDVDKNEMVYISPAYEHIWGRTRQSLYENPISFVEAIHPDDRPHVLAAFALQTTGQYNVEYRVVRPDGSLCWVHDQAFPITTDGHVEHVVGVAADITERKQAEAEQQRLHIEVLRAQSQTLAELSTPLIPVTDEIVVIPLIGSLDTTRIQHFQETLLRGVEQRRARVAIVDLTGVPTVDTPVAHALTQAAIATRLLGAEVVLTGLRPDFAHALIASGIDLRAIVTHCSLQAGIAHALATRGGQLHASLMQPQTLQSRRWN